MTAIKEYYKRSNGANEPDNFYEVEPNKYTMLNFLNPDPVISIHHDRKGDLTGTWCIREVGIPISPEEFKAAFDKAMDSENVVVY